MNRVVICCVLAGFAGMAGWCQEAIPVPESKETTVDSGSSGIAKNSLISRVLKSAEPQPLVPLTSQERFRLYMKGAFGPGSMLGAATVGGFEQLFNTPGEWGQGTDAYRKRVASAYATHVVQWTAEYSASAFLHEDNRYRPSTEKSVWRRSKHAIISAYCSTDAAGRQHFSYSRVGGAGAAAFSRLAWQPRSTGGFGDGLTGAAIILSGQVASNVFREFWPDISRHLLKGK